jgi:exopolysaccharide biosynthesis polyprenyl glycosylphosphotransferase
MYFLEAEAFRSGLSGRLLEGQRFTTVGLAVDASALGLACLVTYLSVGEAMASVVWLFPLLALLAPGSREIYRRQHVPSALETVRLTVAASSMAAVSLLAAIALVSAPPHPTGPIVRVWLVGSLVLALVRVGLLLARKHARVKGVAGQPALIVGAGRIGRIVERRLLDYPERGLVPVGFVDFEQPDTDVSVLGAPSELAQIIDRTSAQHVIVAYMFRREDVLIDLFEACERRQVSVSVVPRLAELRSNRVELSYLGGLPLFHLDRPHPRQLVAKEVFDRSFAAVLLVFMGPLMLAAALAAKLSSRGPALFRQPRVGRDGRVFEMLKFRSMLLDDGEPKPEEGVAAELVRAQSNLSQGLGPGGVEGVDRRTRVGKLLRSTSLDELPQLLNVLKGDMSLIGPRPERPTFAGVFGKDLRRYGDRHRFKSGITGWAQVHGLRGKTSILDRIELDNYYIENWSLWLDFQILLLTVPALFRSSERSRERDSSGRGQEGTIEIRARKGASSDASPTAFRG